MKTWLFSLGAGLYLTSGTFAFASAQLAPSTLKLDAAAVQQAGIVMAKAQLRPFSDELKAPGEVKIDAYTTVLVSPRIDSQVVARKTRLGDLVKAGEPLVTLSSVDVAETESALIMAEQDWQRIAALGPQAVSARRYNEAKVQRDQARAKLLAYGLSEGQIQAVLRGGSARADGSYALLSPVAGRITSDDFIVGERIQPGRPLFTIVDEDTVWVDAQLPPADAGQVSAGDAARILAHDTAFPGTVLQRSHQTNERTRTSLVRIKVNNARDALHPGELVDVRIAVAVGNQVLAVPSEAIVLLQNQPTVFVDQGQGQFEPAPVVTGETRQGWIEIKDGLKVGTPYVRDGAFTLKARLLRSLLGEE
ncbi:efflux RND transporter periplasmic adaptor subunit [Dyella choica]|uniref:Efflux RND transporter periplasmic adaptor subunit n=1 Tax=Dyella choica TaxID=1927959 RepID=A0A432MBA1_9GAMM|nr:efflux RND transporter periplasmic adaptor subunit [Dyella choica]RUL79042.1 efflux RND transporter periplasmic adaptor subunit [Dyella choica]